MLSGPSGEQAAVDCAEVCGAAIAAHPAVLKLLDGMSLGDHGVALTSLSPESPDDMSDPETGFTRSDLFKLTRCLLLACVDNGDASPRLLFGVTGNDSMDLLDVLASFQDWTFDFERKRPKNRRTSSYGFDGDEEDEKRARAARQAAELKLLGPQTWDGIAAADSAAGVAAVSSLSMQSGLLTGPATGHNAWQTFIEQVLSLSLSLCLP